MASGNNGKSDKPKKKKSGPGNPHPVVPSPILARFPELRKVILEHLAKYGDLAGAAQAVRLGYSSVCEYISRNPDFLREAEEALAVHKSRIEQAIYKRAIEGWDEPKFSSRGQIGTVRRFSDVLLMFYAKRHIREYRDADNANVGLPAIQQNNLVLDFSNLTAKQRQALRSLMDETEEESVKIVPVKVSNNGKNGNGSTH